MWLLTGFGSLRAEGSGALSWLLVGGLSLFLAMWTSPCGPCGPHLFPETSKRESACKMEVISFITSTWKWHSFISHWCVLLIRNRLVKGRELHRLWISGSRNHWGHFRSYLLQKATLFLNHQKCCYAQSEWCKKSIE